MSQLQQKHLYSKCSDSENEDVQLQINITLKNVKYTLRVKNVSNLPKIVEDFIIENNLNHKHHKTILNELKRKLEEKQSQNHQKLIKIEKQNRLNQSLKKSCRRVQNDKYMHDISHNESTQSNGYNHHYQIRSKQKNYQISHQKAQRQKQISIQKQNFQSKFTKNQNIQQSLQNSKRSKQKSKQKMDLKKLMLLKIQQQLIHANSNKKKTRNHSNQHQSPKDDHQYSYYKVNSHNYNGHNHYRNQLNSFEQQQKITEHEQTGTKHVYEKWKTKERIKNQRGSKNNLNHLNHHNTTYQNQQNFQSQNISNNVHNHQHDQDWFYKKGLYFQQQKQKNNQKLFKQIYPFTTLKEIKINQNTKTKLHERLFKDKQKALKQMKMVENHVHKNQSLRPNCNQFWNSQVNVNTIKGLSPSMKRKLVQKNRQIKQKIKQKDDEIDVALDQMIKQGIVKNHCSIRKVSLSPFRRTILK